MKPSIVVYKKLVRDKIPEIIEQNGGKANTRILPDWEILDALRAKLYEEVFEFLCAKTAEEMIDELADIYEVLRTIERRHPTLKTEAENRRWTKELTNGGFERCIFLESVEQ